MEIVAAAVERICASFPFDFKCDPVDIVANSTTGLDFVNQVGSRLFSFRFSNDGIIAFEQVFTIHAQPNKNQGS